MSKKLATLLLAVVLVVAMATPALAAEFTPSVAAKDAPTVVAQTGSDGKSYAAIITDADGKEIAGVPADALTVSSIAKATGEVKTAMDAAYKQLTSVASLTELSADLETVLKEAAPGVKVEDLVVRDMFDVSLSEEMLALLKDGAGVTVRFDLSADAALLGAVLHNVSGTEWETIANDKIVRNKDNTVDITFGSLSPIAFLFDGGKLGVDAGAPASPQSGEPETSYAGWIVAGTLFVVAAAAFVAMKKRSSANA